MEPMIAAVTVLMAALFVSFFLVGYVHGKRKGRQQGYENGVSWGRSAERARIEDEWVHPDDWEPQGEA